MRQQFWPFNAVMDEVKMWSYPLDKASIGHEYINLMGGTICLSQEGLLYDVTGPAGEPDCIVNLYDLAEIISANWLNCQEIPTCIADPRL